MLGYAMSTLGEFILQEIQNRQSNARDFALMVGVSHTTINKFLNYGLSDNYAGKPVGEPSLDFLVKLAKATHVDVRTLIALVHPEVGDIDPNDLILAERIGNLPDDQKALIDNFLIGAAIKQTK